MSMAKMESVVVHVYLAKEIASELIGRSVNFSINTALVDCYEITYKQEYSESIRSFVQNKKISAVYFRWDSEQSCTPKKLALTVNDIVAWFMKEYMDPANGVPYISSEGGYQYVNGGPYEARDVLNRMFDTQVADASTNDNIEAALKIIEADGNAWVKVGDY